MKPMTNGEKFKTAEERNEAFRSFCGSYLYCDDCPLDGHDTDNCNRFKWLDLEAEEVKPIMPCPYCGMRVDIIQLTDGYMCACDNMDCCYRSAIKNTRSEIIDAHNHIYKAVKAYKKSEEAKL